MKSLDDVREIFYQKRINERLNKDDYICFIFEEQLGKN